MKLSDEIINSLSLNLREKIRNIKGENIEEIRLRINKPLIINGNQRDYFYNEKNKNLDMNMDNAYMSFSTMVCYSKKHQDLIEKIDLDYVLTETDSPYLAMTKDERNEPVNVVKAVEKIAEIKNIDISSVDEITTNNARRIFNI